MFNTIAKNRVRRNFDLFLIKDFVKKYKKNCRYFGLTGKALHDIIDWNEYIESVLTIEYNKKLIPELIKNIHSNRLESKIKYLSGDIIELICNNDYRIEYPFDLINFDFLGTFIYEKDKKKQGKLRRIEVFKEIVNKQGESLKKNGDGFILLVTLNGQRGSDITVFDNAFKSLKRDENEEIINWLLDDSNNVKQYQKISYVLPSLIIKSCSNLFDIKKFIHIVYQANKTIMVHFGFFLEKNIKAVLDFSDIDLEILHDSDVILINKHGVEEKIKGSKFFASEDPFKNSFSD